jgi:HEPN domain-containing protein
MKEKVEPVVGWLRKAQSESVALDATLRARALDAACFHAQQGVEKYLKAFLTHHEVPFPYTHNLTKLVELCAQVDTNFRSLLPQVEPLTPYAVRPRYDASFWPSQETAEEARSSAHAVLEFVPQRLPDDLRKSDDIRKSAE